MINLNLTHIIDLIKQFDEPIFFFINRTVRTDQLNLIFPLITRLAEPTAFISVCVILFLFGRYKAKLTSILILLATYLTYIFAQVIKEAVNRPRPMDVYSNISVIGTVKYASFPSTHAALIAAVITILCLKYKKTSFVLVPIALLVGVSRIYLGHHYPSDVIGGFILGFSIAVLFLGLDGLIKDIQKI
ncbi:MAG: phosphatase PAP2 family protein [Candidatus Omnitrophica bacterium]|nr:phosphatase PAP2 family protein [Candidatus Omnitrophota bacterium]